MEIPGPRHFHDVLFSQASRKVMFGAPYGYLKI